MQDIKFNKEAIQGFLQMVYMGKVSCADAVISQENVFKSLKGYQMLPIGWVRAAFLLPQKYRDTEGKWCRYTVKDAQMVLNYYLGELFETRVEPNRYGTDQLYVSRNYKDLEEIKKEYPNLFESTDKEQKDYIKYVKRSNQSKKRALGYSLYLSQEDTLVSLIGSSSYPSSSLSISSKDWLLLHTTFSDNRVFHPFTNLKKSQRNKLLPYETDLHASQVVFLSNLIKREAGVSDFTRKIDNLLASGKDIYEFLAKKEGKTRQEMKRELFKTLFGVRDSWVQKDSGYKKMMKKITNTPEYKEYYNTNYNRFSKTHSKLTEKGKRIKFNKLYMRTLLTAMELEVITDLAEQCNQPFVSIHDCLAFTSKQTRNTVLLTESIQDKYNVRFTHKEAVKTTYKAYEPAYLSCPVDLGTTFQPSFCLSE